MGRYGLGAAHKSPWIVPYIGAGGILFGTAAVPTITLTYCHSYERILLIVVADCYLPVASEVLLLSVGLRNVFGFGFSYGVIPWIQRVGFQRAFCSMVGIHCAIVLLGIPLYYWGKWIRHKSATWKVINW